MSVPPTKPPSGSSRSEGSDDDSEKVEKGKPRKEFKLPKKKEKKEEKETPDKEQFEKGVFDLSAKKFGESMKQMGAEEIASSQHISSQQAMEGVKRVYSLIQTMASQLQVGTVGGKDFASLELKTTSAVPEAFQGAQLTLEQTSDGLVIRFDNLQSQANAIQAVEQNKEQLSQMMLNLQAKNVQVAEMHLGDHKVTLPQIPQAGPLEAPPQTGESPMEREGQGQQQDQGDQEEQGPSE